MRTSIVARVSLVGGILLNACTHLDSFSRPDSPEVAHLDSGLTQARLNTFYKLPMGTGIFEFHGFMAIRDPKTDEPFTRNLERFGFLADPDSPDGLPVGMTVERPSGVPFEMIGLNCAACHTAEIHYKGLSFRVDGAPNRIDLFAFKQDLAAAAEHTLHHPEASFTLLRQMAHDHAATRKLLHEVESRNELLEQGELGEALSREISAVVVSDSQNRRDAGTAAPEHSYSSDHSVSHLATLEAHDDVPLAEHNPQRRHRLIEDSLHEWARNVRLFSSWVHIVKANIHSPAEMTPAGPGRADAWGAVRNVMFEPRPLTAPSSIPAIWGVGSYEWFQWNGTTNTNVQRGIAAAIGAGAYFDRRTGESPIRVDNINKLEALATAMHPPRWPEVFPEIDSGKAARGRVLYEAKCAGCHDAVTTTAGGLIRFPEYSIDEIGTDSSYVRNFAEPAGNRSYVAQLQEFMGLMEKKYYDDHAVSAATLDEWEPMSRRPGQWRAPQSYPARPLAGAWSTAPYLHNDSVPTLYDLLLPVAQRPPRFYLGSREFDPQRVGYLSDTGAPGAHFEFDTALPGNSNAGHVYGAELSDAERWDLVEYLKTL